MAFLDGSLAPAKKGKGTKWMLMVDGNGLPLDFHLDSADTAEVTLAEQVTLAETLHAIGVSRPRGRPNRRPEKLVADRGYDSGAFRRALRRPTTWGAKIGRPVVARKEDYRLRYTVERSFTWLGAFRRLLIRWEHLATVYVAFFCVAVLQICLRRLYG
jgi:transposase